MSSREISERINQIQINKHPARKTPTGHIRNRVATIENDIAMRIRPFCKDDLEKMKMWLDKDYIRDFFGDPIDWINKISENIRADWINYFIVDCDSPIGFVQYYETDKAPQGIWSDEPLDTVGIDYLIGDENYLKKGFGTKIIKLLVDKIKANLINS